jgi:hypothetical protein
MTCVLSRMVGQSIVLYDTLRNPTNPLFHLTLKEVNIGDRTVGLSTSNDNGVRYISTNEGKRLYINRKGKFIEGPQEAIVDISAKIDRVGTKGARIGLSGPERYRYLRDELIPKI